MRAAGAVGGGDAASVCTVPDDARDGFPGAAVTLSRRTVCCASGLDGGAAGEDAGALAVVSADATCADAESAVGNCATIPAGGACTLDRER